MTKEEYWKEFDRIAATQQFYYLRQRHYEHEANKQKWKLTQFVQKNCFHEYQDGSSSVRRSDIDEGTCEFCYEKFPMEEITWDEWKEMRYDPENYE